MAEQITDLESPQNLNYNKDTLNIKINPLFALKHSTRFVPKPVMNTPIVDSILKAYPPSIDDDISELLQNVIKNSLNSLGFIRIELDLTMFLEKAKDFENYLLNFLNANYKLTSKAFKKQHLFMTLKQKSFNPQGSQIASKTDNSIETLPFDIHQDPIDKSKLEVCLGDSKLIIVSDGLYGHYLISEQIQGEKSLKVIPKSKQNKKAAS